MKHDQPVVHIDHENNKHPDGTETRSQNDVRTSRGFQKKMRKLT